MFLLAATFMELNTMLLMETCIFFTNTNNLLLQGQRGLLPANIALAQLWTVCQWPLCQKAPVPPETPPSASCGPHPKAHPQLRLDFTMGCGSIYREQSHGENAAPSWAQQAR